MRNLLPVIGAACHSGTRMLKPLLIAACAWLTCVADAGAQEGPQRAVRILVPFAAGGNPDSIARIGAEWLRTRLGQAVVVEDRPGANGAIAAETVARAAPDGYTLFMAALPQMAILPAMTKTPYDPVKDFAPITIVASNDLALAVNDTLPVRTLGAFVEHVKARPGQLAYASAGSGSGTHLTMAMFLQRSGLEMVHVSYRGGAPALLEVVGGQVPAYFGNLAELLPYADKLTLLAVSGERRARQLPNIPTVAEAGYPGFRASTLNAIAAPAATPPEIIARLAEAMASAAQDADFVAKLDRIGVDPVCGTPAEFAATLRADLVTWA